jgi:hypothetical protein
MSVILVFLEKNFLIGLVTNLLLLPFWLADFSCEVISPDYTLVNDTKMLAETSGLYYKRFRIVN